MTGSLVVHERPLDRRGRAVRRAPRTARQRPGAGLSRRAPPRHPAPAGRQGSGPATPRRSAPSRWTTTFTAERLALALRRSPAGDQEGDHGPEGTSPAWGTSTPTRRCSPPGSTRPSPRGGSRPTSTAGCTGRSAASWAGDRLQRNHLPGLPHRHRGAGQLPARALRLRARGRALPALRHPPHRHPRDRRAESRSSATAASREPLAPDPAHRPDAVDRPRPARATGSGRWRRTARRSTG